MQFLFWIIDGLVASWLIGKMMSDQGRDLLMDIIMGVAGGVGGGFIISVAGLPIQGKMIYTNLAAIVGGSSHGPQPSCCRKTGIRLA